MTTVSIREFSHHMAKYLKKLRNGEGFILKYRNEPIAQIMPNKPVSVVPGWKRPIKRVKLKGGGLISETVIRMRREENR